MDAEPQKEHRWLQRLVGDWEFEIDAMMEPGQPPQKFKGSESVRSLGGLWVVAEGQGEMPGGGTATTVMTLGYDPQKGRYLGTFIGSMMTHLWLYDGALDANETALALDTEGPNMAVEGQMAKYQDVIGMTDDGQRTLTSRMLGEDGQWREVVTAHYRRKG